MASLYFNHKATEQEAPLHSSLDATSFAIFHFIHFLNEPPMTRYGSLPDKTGCQTVVALCVLSKTEYAFRDMKLERVFAQLRSMEKEPRV